MRARGRWPIQVLRNNRVSNSASHWYKRSGLLVRLPVSYFLTVLLLALASVRLAGDTPSPDSAPSLVAIGDVHGAYDDFVSILKRVGLIDKQNHWAGGKATFVQVGDLIDRGPKPREVLDLMMALEKEAPEAGGRVVSLLGNHEVMNIMGDVRYVTPENYASFADTHSEERQRSAYQQYVKWRGGHAALLAELAQPMEITEAEWMARHPLGFIEQREAFSPTGEYGKWLREHAPIAKEGGVIFLHGGISPGLAHLSLDTINSHVRDEIKLFDATKQHFVDENVILPFFTFQEIVSVVQAELTAERKSRVVSDEQKQARLTEFLGLGDWLSIRVDGPLWFRGYDQWSDDEGAAEVGKLLHDYHVAHIVTGHTPQKGGRIRPRFGNKVFLIDTGMLSSYYTGGRASALEINDDGKFTAVYLDQQVVLLEGKSAQYKLRKGSVIASRNCSAHDATAIDAFRQHRPSPFGS
jgi:Calcineurin-like phosphoesterase